MNLLEPLGLMSGRSAAMAVEAGRALPLAGGANAFALARLHDDGPVRIVHVDAIPHDFAAALFRVTTRPPDWAGFASDRALVMGIVNVTPDSFSDGGDHLDPDLAIVAGRAMAAAGADIIDVGGESTRPGAGPVDPVLEQRRVLPVVAALASVGLVVSIDTRNAATMRASLDAGARIVNDVSGLTFDPLSVSLMRERGCAVVVMHTRGTPLTMHGFTHYSDVAVEVTREIAATLAEIGLAPGAVAVDPGIGFAKGAGHNEAVLARLPLLLNLGAPILVGASRKGFIGRILEQTTPKDRIAGSLAAALTAWRGGARILRVHDVAETVQAVKLYDAVHLAG